MRSDAFRANPPHLPHDAIRSDTFRVRSCYVPRAFQLNTNILGTFRCVPCDGSLKTWACCGRNACGRNACFRHLVLSRGGACVPHAFRMRSACVPNRPSVSSCQIPDTRSHIPDTRYQEPCQAHGPRGWGFGVMGIMDSPLTPIPAGEVTGIGLVTDTPVPIRSACVL